MVLYSYFVYICTALLTSLDWKLFSERTTEESTWGVTFPLKNLASFVTEAKRTPNIQGLPLL